MNSWKEIPPPIRKKDYVSKRVRLKVRPPEQIPEGFGTKKHGPDVGDVLRVVRRLNAKETADSVRDVAWWGDIRLLDSEYACAWCGTAHRVYIPEAWIAEGKAVFVEEDAS